MLWVVVSKKALRTSKGNSMEDNERRSSDIHIVLMQQKLDDHIDDFHKHCSEEVERWDTFITMQKTNTESIKELVVSNKELSDSTRDIVSVWKAADGTVKVMSAFGRFVKWLSGLV